MVGGGGQVVAEQNRVNPSTSPLELEYGLELWQYCISVIITGGYLSGHQNVLRYGEDGFKEYLPSLKEERFSHACSGYYDGESNLVLLVFGGFRSEHIEKLNVKRDSQWTSLSKSFKNYAYPFVVSINNDIFGSLGTKGCAQNFVYRVYSLPSRKKHFSKGK